VPVFFQDLNSEPEPAENAAGEPMLLDLERPPAAPEDSTASPTRHRPAALEPAGTEPRCTPGPPGGILQTQALEGAPKGGAGSSRRRTEDGCRLTGCTRGAPAGAL